MSETAYYLFCFARSGLLPELSGTGVDGERPLLVRRFAGLAAVLSTVLVADFCGPAAEARMEDISWLGIRAWRHETVIEQVMVHSPVFPARFGTIFSSLENLERLQQRHRSTISQFLDRMTDHEEWGVKGVLNRERALQGLQSGYQAGMNLASLPPGMRYLREQRARMAAEKELHQWLQKTCARVADELRGYATDLRARQVIATADPDGASEVVLNWAFLAPRSARTDLCGHVERASAELADQGLTFEITGPWPPYNFTPPLVD
jgi:Gas vesicle synthesis protein GvpL/GvpF